MAKARDRGTAREGACLLGPSDDVAFYTQGCEIVRSCRNEDALGPSAALQPHANLASASRYKLNRFHWHLTEACHDSDEG